MARDFIPNGMIYDERDTDFRFWDAMDLMEKIKKAPKPKAWYVYSFNQAKDKRTRNFCTVVWPICAILSYRGMSWTDEQWIELRNYAVENYWYVSSQWHFKTTWETCALKYWNAKYPDKQMLSFTENRQSANYWKALSLWYHACVWYAGNALWNSDRLDLILSETNHWKQTYWHIRRDAAVDSKYIVALDNYKWRYIWGKEVNHYLIPRWNLWKLWRTSWNTWYFPSATFFVALKEISEVPLDVTKYWLSELKKNSIKWNEFENDQRLSDKTRKEYQDYLHKNNNEIRAKFIS